MSDGISREEFERGIDEFADGVEAILRSALPPQVVAEAEAWLDGVGSTRDLNAARRQYASAVDAFIRRLPHHDVAGQMWVDAALEPPPVVALTMERIVLIRHLMKAMPPKRTGGGFADFLEDWAIEAFYLWLDAAEKRARRDEP